MAHFAVLILAPYDDRMTEEDIRAQSTVLLAPFERGPDNWQNRKWDSCGPPFPSDIAAMIGDYDPEADELNWEICPHCWGTGKIEDTDPDQSCVWCKGEGSRTKWRRISNDIVAVPIIRPDFAAYALITPQGEWIEWPYRMPRDQWREQFQQMLKSYRHCLAVLVDCHS